MVTTVITLDLFLLSFFNPLLCRFAPLTDNFSIAMAEKAHGHCNTESCLPSQTILERQKMIAETQSLKFKTDCSNVRFLDGYIIKRFLYFLC